MRITGGAFKGRTLATPRSAAIRPTSDRTREALFSILTSRSDAPDIEGARVIDLFAGTGVLGLEALSRGAHSARFVDQSAEARGLIRDNIERLGLEGVTRLLRRDATKLGEAQPRDAADFVFLDPPYGKGLGERALNALHSGGWLKPHALLVLEERTGQPIELPWGFEEIDTRTYGEASLHILCLKPVGAARLAVDTP